MEDTSNEWAEFFNAHATKYMEEPFTRATKEEVHFILEALELSKGSRILDIGCGTGRHAVALAKAGYRILGVDISEGMLAEARRHAEQEGVEVEWMRADASKLKLEESFEAAICLCEGAFGLLGSMDDPLTHELEILRGIHAALLPGGKFILTAPNGLLKIRQATEEQVKSGDFNPMTLTEKFTLSVDTASGSKEIPLRERGFIPSELRLMFSQSGFEVEAIYGGTAGAWNRGDVRLDEMEVMVIGYKPKPR